MLAKRIRNLVLVTGMLVLGQSAIAQEKLINQLRDHPAPYLALHGEDPVAWQDWNQATVDLARSQNKVLVISVGYFSCHWCHVMQEESYQDEQIADLLNRHFIPVKVDRELHPALDDRLMDFAQGILGRGGWPLNVFVTPDGHPIFAVLYAPPEHFMGVLERMHEVWARGAESVRRMVAAENLPEYADAAPALDPITFNLLLDASVPAMLARGDTLQGGFGEQQKFPSVPQLNHLLQQYSRKPDPEVRQFLELTLASMANLGLYDHLAGGFFRYTVDPGWEIPHFEKMLYDNISLAGLYLDAAEVLRQPELAAVGHQTMEFMTSTMWQERGAFISSFSAVDDKDVEGGSYLWTPEQVNAELSGEQSAMALEIWNLDRPVELPAGNHLRFDLSLEDYAARHDLDLADVKSAYDSVRRQLLDSRNQRVLPADDKLLASWNAMALSLFTRAAKKYPERGYDAYARSLKDFIANDLIQSDDVVRSYAGGLPMGTAALEDYAYVARGLADYGQYLGDESDLELASKVANWGWERFHRQNAWYHQDRTLLAPVAGEEVLSDSAYPAASAVLIEVSLRIAALTDDRQLRERSLSALNRGQQQLATAPFWYAGQFGAVRQALSSGN